MNKVYVKAIPSLSPRMQKEDFTFSYQFLHFLTCAFKEHKN